MHFYDSISGIEKIYIFLARIVSESVVLPFKHERWLLPYPPLFTSAPPAPPLYFL